MTDRHPRYPNGVTNPELSEARDVTIMLTGAAGFVGSACLETLLKYTNWHVVCPVSYRHRGDGSRLNDAIRRATPLGKHIGETARRVHVFYHDLTLPILRGTAQEIEPVDIFWNVASESHVDRSLVSPSTFIRNNVELELNVLEFARVARPGLVLQMSTDEVYGPASEGYAHREWDALRPSNPYSASKAAQEAIAYSYWRSFNVPLILTNTMNLLGPRQHTEKFVPKTIRALRAGEPVTIHATAEGESGSRCWIDVADFARDWLNLTLAYFGDESVTYYPGMPDEPHRFNIVGEEVSNLEVAQLLAEVMEISDAKFDLVDFHTSRPGHDLRYALDGSKYYNWHLERTGVPPYRTPIIDTLERIIRES